MRITKPEISMRRWRSPMSATSQGAFVVIPEISRGDISHIIKNTYPKQKKKKDRSVAIASQYVNAMDLSFSFKIVKNKGDGDILIEQCNACNSLIANNPPVDSNPPVPARSPPSTLSFCQPAVVCLFCLVHPRVCSTE